MSLSMFLKSSRCEQSCTNYVINIPKNRNVPACRHNSTFTHLRLCCSKYEMARETNSPALLIYFNVETYFNSSSFESL